MLILAYLPYKLAVSLLERWSRSQDRMYDSIERSVSVDGLQAIGAPASEQVAWQSSHLK